MPAALRAAAAACGAGDRRTLTSGGGAFTASLPGGESGMFFREPSEGTMHQSYGCAVSKYSVSKYSVSDQKSNPTIIDHYNREAADMKSREEIQAEIEAKLEAGRNQVEELKKKMADSTGDVTKEMKDALAEAEEKLAGGMDKLKELKNASDEHFNELRAQAEDNWDNLSKQVLENWESLTNKVK